MIVSESVRLGLYAMLTKKTKQQSMSATAGVLWLCACVWDGVGGVLKKSGVLLADLWFFKTQQNQTRETWWEGVGWSGARGARGGWGKGQTCISSYFLH